MPITLDGSNGITTPTYGGADTSEYLVPVTQFKSRIINGGMTIDQRNAGASVSVNDATVYTVDRWSGTDLTDGAFTVQRDTSAPAGFINSIKITTTTADGSLAATQAAQIRQEIEGFNTADLMWGTANAKTVTLSFWVRSSLTGTFGGSLRNDGLNRSYPFSYTISVADTWEYKTVTITGDTSGTWLTDNGVGIRVTFGLGAGADRSGTAGAWNSNNNVAPTGAVSVIGTLNATWYITGVQLEVGSTATSFDYRPYGTELALCQRYYEIGDGPSFVVVSNVTGVFPNKAFSVTKRASSTVTISPAGGTGAAVTSGIAGFYQSTSHSGNSQTSWTASAEL